MSNFTAMIYCKECGHSKAYYHGIYSKLPTVSYFCYYHCKKVQSFDSCEMQHTTRTRKSIDDSVADLPMEAYYYKEWRRNEVEE